MTSFEIALAAIIKELPTVPETSKNMKLREPIRSRPKGTTSSANLGISDKEGGASKGAKHIKASGRPVICHPGVLGRSSEYHILVPAPAPSSGPPPTLRDCSFFSASVQSPGIGASELGGCGLGARAAAHHAPCSDPAFDCRRRKA